MGPPLECHPLGLRPAPKRAPGNASAGPWTPFVPPRAASERPKTDQERDWTAGAKQAMDQVLKDRDAEIASRTDGTAVPTGAIPAFAKAFFNHQMM